MPLEYRSSWDADQPRDTMTAVKRGFMGRCPQCGEGKLFGKFLKVRVRCEHCDLNFEGHRADDMPPYIVIMIVGHVVVALNLFFERQAEWPMWVHFAIWPPLTLGLSLVLLQPVKGALIGYQWALKMHGFDPDLTIREPVQPVPAAEPR